MSVTPGSSAEHNNRLRINAAVIHCSTSNKECVMGSDRRLQPRYYEAYGGTTHALRDQGCESCSSRPDHKASDREAIPHQSGALLSNSDFMPHRSSSAAELLDLVRQTHA